MAKVSLLNLNRQMIFEIGGKVKEQLCFAETLMISCGHIEGEIGTDEESTCESSTHVTVAQEEPEQNNDKDEEDEKQSEDIPLAEETECDEYQIFFFPDCKKPVRKQESTDEIIMKNGFPMLNRKAQGLYACHCKTADCSTCPCHSKHPCHCGSKTKLVCTCSALENICVCNPDEIQPKCVCRPSQLCLCTNQLEPVCKCDLIEKPCICDPNKFPLGDCTCTTRYAVPTSTKDSDMSEQSNIDENLFIYEHQSLSQVCDCQTVAKKECVCNCDKECICNEIQCDCTKHGKCLCEKKSSDELLCTCQGEPDTCKCLSERVVCTCDNSDRCDCISETGTPVDGDLCPCSPTSGLLPCYEKPKILSDEPCTCSGPPRGEIIKKVRKYKDGYRWCNEVDPRHTFFDYAYNLHHKIETKEEPLKRIEIIGLHSTKEGVIDVGPADKTLVPPYKKKVHKASIDCCSTVGGITISVEAIGEGKDRFLVQVVSNFSKDGAETKSTLVSIVDCNLHTLEENRTEFICKRDMIKEKRNYVSICDDGYYNKITNICNDKSTCKRHYFTFDQAHDFLLEGANVVLLRYMGLNRFKGSIKTGTITICGAICESIYVSQGVSQAIVNNKPMFVVRVQRHIIEPDGIIHQSMSVLSLKGYLISHEWGDSPYMMHINPLLNMNPDKDEIEPHVPLRETWRQDLQLMSDFLEMKAERTSEGGLYARDNAELTASIKDYLQLLLMLKPADAMNFTRQYFSSALSSVDLPHDEYFDSCRRHVRYFYLEQ